MDLIYLSYEKQLFESRNKSMETTQIPAKKMDDTANWQKFHMRNRRVDPWLNSFLMHNATKRWSKLKKHIFLNAQFAQCFLYLQPAGIINFKQCIIFMNSIFWHDCILANRNENLKNENCTCSNNIACFR